VTIGFSKITLPHGGEWVGGWLVGWLVGQLVRKVGR